MQKGKFNVVVDGCYGSTGKGLIATTLAYHHRPEFISTTNYANAGHTAVNVDGTAHIAKALPSPAILSKWVDGYNPTIVVGAGAAFTLDQIQKEIKLCDLPSKNLIIHPRAGVITGEHKLAESGAGESSTKHIASTMQGCGTFMADKILRKKGLKLARDYVEIEKYVYKEYDHESMQSMLCRHMTGNQTILHEGAQGYSLDINLGHSYPQATSRCTTAMQNMADMGISAKMLGDIYLVIRPFPIRVGNVVEGDKVVGESGGCYHDQREMTWEEVAQIAGMPKDMADLLKKTELTTVTKRLRRVFTFSRYQLVEAARTNGATRIALNFANYIDWECFGCNEYSKLTDKVKKFITQIEDLTGLPVTMIGTGPQINHVIMV